MLGGADNPNGELLSYIIGADTSRFSAIKRHHFWCPYLGYKIQLIVMPVVAFFITTTSKSLILAVGYQPFTSHADTENSSVM